jgi:hypothetical protein
MKSVPLNLVCAKCGVEFQRLPYLARYRKQYCSITCSASDRQRKEQDGTCETCGRPFVRRAWAFGKGRFCSKRCSNKASGNTASAWKGGTLISQSGYRQIRVGRRYFFEHRLVAAEKIGRPLLPTERVHHLNHDRLDNRPENLQVVSPSEHQRIHMSDPARVHRHGRCPAMSTAMRRRWANPEQRAAMTAAIRRGKGLLLQ